MMFVVHLCACLITCLVHLCAWFWNDGPAKQNTALPVEFVTVVMTA